MRLKVAENGAAFAIGQKLFRFCLSWQSYIVAEYLAQLPIFAPVKSPLDLGCSPMDFRSVKTFEEQAGRLYDCTLTASSLLNDYLVETFFNMPQE